MERDHLPTYFKCFNKADELFNILGNKRIGSTPIFIAALFTEARKWKTAQTPTRGRTHKQNVVYTYHGILGSPEKEQESDMLQQGSTWDTLHHVKEPRHKRTNII